MASWFQLTASDSVTQIVYVRIHSTQKLDDPRCEAGRQWQSMLDLIERSDGLVRMYWGRCLEQPDNVQLHIVRRTLAQHHDFLRSSIFSEVKACIDLLASTSDAIQTIRHASLVAQTPNCEALSTAPFTGSAIYLQPTSVWNEGAWPLWTHIVPHVDGNLGCAGGAFLEPVTLLSEPVLHSKGTDTAKVESNQRWDGYVVYVGWQTTQQHETYHHTQHFRDHRAILRAGNVGYAEYGHVCFQGSREARKEESRLW